jgi:hypothetical protein
VGTYVEEVVEEDERHRNPISYFTPNTQSCTSHGEAHRAPSRSKQHQFEAAYSLDDKVRHGRPEHPLHRIASGKDERQSRRETKASLENDGEVVGD